LFVGNFFHFRGSDNCKRKETTAMGLAMLGILLFIGSVVLGKLPAGKTAGRNGMTTTLLRVGSVILVLAGTLSSGVTIVPAGYRGVLLRFGAVTGVLGEGIHFVVPGVNQVVLLEVRTQKEVSQSTAASKDLQVVTANIALNFHINKEQAATLYQNVGTEYRARIIDPVVQESLKVVTARYTAEELIRLRDKVKNEVEREITQRLGVYNIAVEPMGVSITNFDFSDEFNKAIEQKQVAQQMAEKQKYVLQQAQLEAQTSITKAKGVAESGRINAQALQVQGGRLVLAREWIDKWDGKLPTVQGGSGTGE
jgi:regulator of protease activity HflC (stomatin/prohibitin superfamily)